MLSPSSSLGEKLQEAILESEKDVMFCKRELCFVDQLFYNVLATVAAQDKSSMTNLL